MYHQIEMKVADAIELYKGLEAVKQHKGARFAVIVARNVKELEKLLKQYEEVAKPSAEFIEVSGKAHKLAEAEDEEGIKKLEEEHSDLISERKSQLAALEETMQQTIEISLQTIKEEQLPEDVTPEQVVPILPIVV